MQLQEAVSRWVPAPSKERGDRYYDEGRVGRLSAAGSFVSAQVRGESGHYSVEMELRRDVLWVSCECPFFEREGRICKHIWAVIRQSDYQERLTPGGRLSRVEIGFAALEEDDWDDRDDGQSGELVPFTLPRGSKPSSWKLRMEEVLRSRPSRSPAQREPLPEEILYVIGQHGGGVRSAIQMRFLGRSRKKNGEWGKPRDLRLTADRLAELPEPDREILSLLNAEGFSDAGLPVQSRRWLRGRGARWFLERMAMTGRLHREIEEKDLSSALQWDPEPWKLRIEVSENGSNYQISGSFERGSRRLQLGEADVIGAGVVVAGTVVAPLDASEEFAWIEVLTRGPIDVPQEDRDQLIESLSQAPPVTIDLPADLRWQEEAPKPEPRLVLESEFDSIAATVIFRYGQLEAKPSDSQTSWRVESRVVRRDRDRENEMLGRLSQLQFTRDYYIDSWKIRPAFLGAALERLLEEGWEIELDARSVRAADALEAEIESGIDWFDLKGGARFGDQTLTIPQLLATVDRGSSFITLPDGSAGLVPRDWLSQFTDLIAVGESRKDSVRFRKSQAILIDALLLGRAGITLDRKFQGLRDRLSSSQPRAMNESERFRGELRPYQRDGLGWIHFLRELGLGGCLADDMGLGKTIQALAFLDQVERGRPSLVVAPKTLLFNWRQEAARFTPHLRVLELHGTDRVRDPGELTAFDIVLTTYGTLRADIGHLEGVEFEVAILDEAQAIKNASSQAAKASRLLRARHRLALSGTPIENHLGELWSLFEFLNPGMLGPARSFGRQFAGRGVPPERRHALAAALRPLILRRTKEQVAPELPEKLEQTLWCELEGTQREKYDELREYYRHALLDAVRSKGMGAVRMQVLEALLRLRQAACHPALIDRNSDGESAKLDLLLEELSDVLESGHQALVFSQFTSFLHLLAARLDAKRVRYLYLDGKTPNRQQVVESFQRADGPPLFLISLKAGGVGLNLTRADYVFLLDPWWNPAVEAQAIDRAHRIGQEQRVFAYRLIARDTVEERILELQDRKKSLADSIISEDNSVLQRLEVEDLEKLLS